MRVGLESDFISKYQVILNFRALKVCGLSLFKAIKERIIYNHVFQHRGKPITDIRKGLKLACKGAGIKYGRFVKDGFIFHDLRHTFNTNMRKAGVPESVIMEITGHSTREMFDRYDTIDEDDTRKAIEKLGYFFKVLPKTLPKSEKNEEKK